MIDRESFSEEHIRHIQKEFHSDPALIERTVFAFGLLEALRCAGLNFVFKGGTSLILLLKKPRRFSTDIDIVVEPGTDIDSFIREASRIFPFYSKQEQIRKGKNNIPKRHFKFQYLSPLRNGPLYILLDVLFEKNLYIKIVEKEIQSRLLVTKGRNQSVSIPSIDCILGDKLAAFAPHTIGILLGKDKDMEVIKQFYDVCTLIEEFENIEDVCRTYGRVAQAECSYRGLHLLKEETLMDTLQSAACIGSRGKISPEDFPFYLQGTRDIANHIFEERYSMEMASKAAPKVMYLAACLMTGTQFTIVKDGYAMRNEKLYEKETMTMKSFRKQRNDSYPYLVLTDQLLHKYRS